MGLRIRHECVNCKFIIFFLQWAKIILVLEKGLNQTKLSKMQKEYSVKLGEPPKDMEGDTEYRGLMVIKTSSKTKARQRKGAISNWKVCSDYDEELKVSL